MTLFHSDKLLSKNQQMCVCQPTCVVGELNRVDRVHLEPQDLKHTHTHTQTHFKHEKKLIQRVTQLH